MSARGLNVDSRTLSRRRSRIRVVSTIEAGFSGWGVILSLAGGGCLLRVENLGGQRDLVVRLDEGGTL